MTYPAHIRIDETEHINSVSAHCRKSAEYAAATVGPKLGNTAYLVGLLHDMGKYSNAFGDYIRRAAAGEPVKRGSVNHTFAGVRFALERWHSSTDPYARLASELIACTIGAHHGLFDCIDPDGRNGFDHRLTKDGIFYAETKERFLEDCADTAELDKLFATAKAEVEAIFAECKAFASSAEELQFYMAMTHRMLLSALVYGDRKDAAEFKLAAKLPELPENLSEIWDSTLQRVEAQLLEMPQDKEIEKARRQISDECAKAGKLPTGIYRLSAPTGGGKTLSGLRYALSAAAEHSKKRIFFVVPLLTVLEQNAGEIRKAVGDDSLILEHHSNIIREKKSFDELDENELLTETWDSPIIITTLVQLLNTLFLGAMSSVRRTQALSDAVVVIDEVQSVPQNMLTLFNLALNNFSQVFGTTFVLCSATQPCLEKADHPIRFNEPVDILAYDEAIWGIFRRTQVFNSCRAGGYTAQELAEFAHECLGAHGSTLLICNKKAQAKAIFAAAKAVMPEGVYHLSTAMCMQHRMDTLEAINFRLDNKLPVVCISTQLVEAGVDFSFGCVIRLLAGLDNVVQSAGRCNRNSECEGLSPVYIMNYRDENLTHLKEIKRAQVATGAVLYRFEKNSEPFKNNITSDEAISAYYQALYNEMPDRFQDFSVNGPAGSKGSKSTSSSEGLNTSIYAMLSANKAFGQKCKKYSDYMLKQAFGTAGEAFSVFDNKTQDAIVPYGEGAQYIEQLSSDKAKYSLKYRKAILEKAKRFTVSLFDYEIKALEKRGGIYTICDGAVYAIMGNSYSDDVGIADVPDPEIL